VARHSKTEEKHRGDPKQLIAGGKKERESVCVCVRERERERERVRERQSDRERVRERQRERECSFQFKEEDSFITNKNGEKMTMKSRKNMQGKK
jgi:hypothetical protein